ncbi:MAG: hypothetical protein LUC99_01505 [Clostridiales bacterium]|nr:hypothetical protein [Clostridiales bacterium]
MKYIVTMNGNRYEVEVERVSPFHLLSHEEVAADMSAPPSGIPVPQGSSNEATDSIDVRKEKRRNGKLCNVGLFPENAKD